MIQEIWESFICECRGTGTGAVTIAPVLSFIENKNKTETERRGDASARFHLRARKHAPVSQRVEAPPSGWFSFI